MRVITYESKVIDLNKKHIIEFKNDELITIMAALSRSSQSGIERELADQGVFTKDFSNISTPFISNELKELLKKENIVREDF